MGEFELSSVGVDRGSPRAGRVFEARGRRRDPKGTMELFRSEEMQLCQVGRAQIGPQAWPAAGRGEAVAVTGLTGTPGVLRLSANTTWAA